jgi:tellurite resistance protein
LGETTSSGFKPPIVPAGFFGIVLAGGFVTAGVSAALGYPDWGQRAFGVALFSWFAIESVLLHRLHTVETLPIALRPTLGIQLAPPVVGAVAYLAINGEAARA